MGSPPPAGSKNDVLKLRSVRSMVMAPAKTGSESIRRIEVSKILHTNRGTFHQFNLIRLLIIVVTKLIAPKILLIPAKWREKIPRSTAMPL